MIWAQERLDLSPRSRGLHPITPEVNRTLSRLPAVSCGTAHLFLLHTSAGLTVNENADPDVPLDLRTAIDKLVPEDWPYRHTCEGPDDMPAHVKSLLAGVSLTLPVTKGRLSLGTWQGVYLCEFRNHAGPRSVVVTLSGQPA